MVKIGVAMSDLKHDISTKLFWVDLEMTGLHPINDRILEVAAIITDFDFNEIDVYESVIYQPPEVLQIMNDWARQAHSSSGLIDRVQAGSNEQHVVAELSDFVIRNFKGEPAILAGNSIHQDRRFIRQWWPDIEQLLHYRMLDVSSFKIIMQNKYGIEFTKKETHTALSDIQESIAELKFYLSNLNL